MLPLLLSLALASPSPLSASAAGLALGDGRVIALPCWLDLEPAAAVPAALSWRPVEGGLEATANGERVRATIRLSPSSGAGFDLEVTLRYLAVVEVEREAIRLRLPGPAQALGRNLDLAPLASPLRVDRGTPVLLEAPGLVLVGGRGLEAAHYLPLADGTVEVQLMLGDPSAHPFAVYQQCLERLPEVPPGGPVSFAALERKRTMDRVARQPGEIVTGRATLYPVAAGGDARPLIVERWPDGASAAVVFTDHADRTDPEALRAILHGDSRAVCAPPRRGFLGHGVKITKSFFLHDGRGGLDDPATAALAQELLEAGSEVASHSVSGRADDREAVRAGLPPMARFRVETWIDHQPYTNCEAISNQGWRSDGRYGIRDLLVAAGYRWLWEAGDLAGFAPEPRLENLLAAVGPGRADPPIYPLPADGRLWVFQSTLFFGSPERMGAAISDPALRRLEAERGLFVGHTYLSASARTTTRPEHLAWLAVRPAPGGDLELAPAIEAALGRIAQHVRAGALATLTLAEAGDRLRALGDLEVVYLPDGSALVENHGTQLLAGLTVAVPGAEAELSVEGSLARGRDLATGRSRVWFDLQPGASAWIRAQRDQQTVPLLAAERARLVIPPERQARTAPPRTVPRGAPPAVVLEGR